jgi:hypothetical protein
VDRAPRSSYRDAVPEWLTIEVFDAEYSASSWRRSHESFVTEAAMTHGASEVNWHATHWGVVLELAFTTDESLERFRTLPAVRAALDQVPDWAHGLVLYRGRGGGAGARVPRRPVPAPVADAAPWPDPEPHEYVRLTGGPVLVA